MMTSLSRNNTKYYFFLSSLFFSCYFLCNVGQGLHNGTTKGIEESLTWDLLFDLLFLSQGKVDKTCSFDPKPLWTV